MPEINKEDSVFQNDDGLYGKKIVPKPAPEKNIGVDTTGETIDQLATEAIAGTVDIGTFESFLSVSRSRNEVYDALDVMCDDPMVAAALEVYASTATEYNQDGKIVWCESDDPYVSKYVTFLLDTMNVDKNAYGWMHSMCKYGDLYLRLYRESETGKPATDKKALNEDVRLVAHAGSDHYSNYVEAEPNPAELFELTGFGKSCAYVKADSRSTGLTKDMSTGMPMLQQFRYRFNRNDVTVYPATDYVHASILDTSSRTPEEVSLFDGTDSEDGKSDVYTYRVRRGQSIFYNLFRIWREKTLLENAILLNRVTRSSIVRIIGVQVGDMAKTSVGPYLQRIKQLIEQKAAINTGSSMSEYTNPGPIENNVYVPIRGEQGAITTSQVGGDVDVKSLADLDYFNTKFYGALRVPKQYLGDTDDSTGFNGGSSLTLVSSRFAKAIKRIQNPFMQAITDAINLMLLDRGLENYVNRFEIHMVPPLTQDEVDRRESISNQLGVLSDTMNILSDLPDTSAKLTIVKALLADILPNQIVMQTLQEQIDKVKSEEEKASPDEAASVEDEEEGESSSDAESDIMSAFGGGGATTASSGEEAGAEEEIVAPAGETSEEEGNLPSPEELGVDMTDNEQEF